MAGGERRCTVQASDGVDVAVWLAAPPDPRGVMVLCHGLTTNRDEHGAFVAIRDRALRRGIAVARFDFRAHGESGGTNEALRLDGMRADVDAVQALVDRELGAGLPSVPVGLSFGGAAAIHAAAARPAAAGLVLWYAVIDYEHNYGPQSPVAITRRLRASRAADDPPWSEMPVLAEGFHFPRELVAALPDDPTPRTIAALDVPVLVIHGSRDPYVDVAPARRLASEHHHIRLRLAHGAGHGFLLWRPWVVRRTVAFADRAIRDSARTPV